MKSDFEYIEKKLKLSIEDNDSIIENIGCSALNKSTLPIFVELQKLNLENLKLLKELYKDNIKNEQKDEPEEAFDMKSLSTLIEENIPA